MGQKGFLQFVQTVLGISILHDDQNEYDKDKYDKQQQQHWIKIQCMEKALIQRLIQGILQLIVPSVTGSVFCSRRHPCHCCRPHVGGNPKSKCYNIESTRCRRPPPLPPRHNKNNNRIHNNNKEQQQDPQQPQQLPLVCELLGAAFY